MSFDIQIWRAESGSQSDDLVISDDSVRRLAVELGERTSPGGGGTVGLAAVAEGGTRPVNLEHLLEVADRLVQTSLLEQGFANAIMGKTTAARGTDGLAQSRLGLLPIPNLPARQGN